MRTDYRPYTVGLATDWCVYYPPLADLLRPWHQTIVCACYSSRLIRTLSHIRRYTLRYSMRTACASSRSAVSLSALPHAHPYRLRYYSRRNSHLSAYASTLFGWVPYACRVAFGVLIPRRHALDYFPMDFFTTLLSIATRRRSLYQLSKSNVVSDTHVKQCKQIATAQREGRFFRRFRIIGRFLHWE